MKNVAKKLLNVTDALDGKVKKSGYNSYSKYTYVTEADLIDAIRPELIKQGLIITTSVLSFSETPASEDDDNRYASVTLKHTIIDTESGESIELHSAGTGADRLDKALYKSYTGALKYFLLKTFMLSGDDDPENDGVVKKPTPAKPAASKPAPAASKPKTGMFQKKQAKEEEVEEEEEEKPKTKTKPEPEKASKPSFNKFSKASKGKEEEPEEEDEEVDDGDEDEDAAF